MILLKISYKNTARPTLNRLPGTKKQTFKNTVMRTKTIKQLSRSLDFTTDFEMYEYFISCHMNGNFTSCRNLFNQLTKQAKKDVLSYLIDGGFNREYNFYFELL